MVTVNVFLWKRPNKDGSYTLYLRITKDRKHSYISLGKSIKESEWDQKAQRVKKSHPNSARLNHFLSVKKSEAEGKSLELEATREDVTSISVVEKIKPAKSGGFFTLADAYLKELKEAGKYNRYTPDKSRITNFKTYIKRNIPFSEITVGLLERFQNHLRSTTEQSERSIVNHRRDKVSV
jgi:integrase/recombinase XerD